MKFGKYVLVSVLSFLTLPKAVLAATDFGDAADFLGQAAAPAGYEGRDVTSIVAAIVQGALTLVGIAFLVLMVYAGFLWMTARGNEEQVNQAKNTLIAAIIGIIVVVGAYAIANFVTGALI